MAKHRVKTSMRKGITIPLWKGLALVAIVFVIAYLIGFIRL